MMSARALYPHLRVTSSTTYMMLPNVWEMIKGEKKVFLEHPAHSKLWQACDLPLPGEPADRHGGFTLAVAQCDWGHVARKRTWLYCVRPTRIPPMPPPREPTHWICGSRTGRNAYGGRIPPGIKKCSTQQIRRTPPAFAAWLIELAASCR